MIDAPIHTVRPERDHHVWLSRLKQNTQRAQHRLLIDNTKAAIRKVEEARRGGENATRLDQLECTLARQFRTNDCRVGAVPSGFTARCTYDRHLGAVAGAKRQGSPCRIRLIVGMGKDPEQPLTGERQNGAPPFPQCNAGRSGWRRITSAS